MLTPETTTETPNKLFNKAKAAFAAGDIEQGKALIKRMEELMPSNEG